MGGRGKWKGSAGKVESRKKEKVEEGWIVGRWHGNRNGTGRAWKRREGKWMESGGKRKEMEDFKWPARSQNFTDLDQANI